MAQLQLEQFILSIDAHELKEQLKDVLYTIDNDLESSVEGIVDGIFNFMDTNHENIIKVLEYDKSHQGKGHNKFTYRITDFPNFYVLAVAFRD